MVEVATLQEAIALRQKDPSAQIKIARVPHPADKMTVKELQKTLKEEGVEFESDDNKPRLVEKAKAIK